MLHLPGDEMRGSFLRTKFFVAQRTLEVKLFWLVAVDLPASAAFAARNHFTTNGTW